MFVVSLLDSQIDKIAVAVLYLFYKFFFLVFDTVSQDSAIEQYSEVSDCTDSYCKNTLYIYRNSLQYDIVCLSEYINNRNVLQYKKYQILQFE